MGKISDMDAKKCISENLLAEFLAPYGFLVLCQIRFAGQLIATFRTIELSTQVFLVILVEVVGV